MLLTATAKSWEYRVIITTYLVSGNTASVD
jgi:hypothetical protein